MTTKANRRGSVEVQQLALWKHQQNLEEIKMLKANNSIRPASPTEVAKKAESNPFSPEGLLKLSKLAARKNKETSEPSKMNFQAVVAHVMNDAREHLPPQQHLLANSSISQHKPIFAPHPETSAARNASDISNNDVVNRADLEALLKEKQQWLRTIHEDNGKMAKMLKDLQEAKLSLARKMDEIETERQTQLQQSREGRTYRNVLEEVEIFLREESEISERKRDLALPAVQLEPAAELQRELMVIAAQFRLNQGETREFFYKTVRQTVNSFVTAALAEEEDREAQQQEEQESGRGGGGADEGNSSSGAGVGAARRAQAELNHQLEVLRALAATGPGNIRAAESVAASVASAIIRAAGERTVDLMRLHQADVDRRHFQGLRDELAATQRENLELKTSLAQLRKSNVQLRMKAAATMMMPSARRVSSSASIGGGSVHGGGGGVAEGKEGDSVYGGTVQDESALDRPLSPIQGQQELLLASAPNAAVGSVSSILQSSERLPKCVERYLQRELAQHAQQVIEGHPLAATLTPAMVGNLSKELSREVQGVAAAAFFAFMHHRLGQSELPESLLNGTITSIGAAGDGLATGTGEGASHLTEEDRRVCEQVREAVEHVLQVSTVHTELSALVTLYLTYLHCRPKNQPFPPAGSTDNGLQQRMMAHTDAVDDGQQDQDGDDADSVQGVLLMEEGDAFPTGGPSAASPARFGSNGNSRSQRGPSSANANATSTTTATAAPAGTGTGAGTGPTGTGVRGTVTAPTSGAQQSSPRSPMRQPPNNNNANNSSNSTRSAFGSTALAATAIAKMRKTGSATGGPELGTSLLDGTAPQSPGASLPRYMQAKSKR